MTSTNRNVNDFLIELESKIPFKEDEIEYLITKCKYTPDEYIISYTNYKVKFISYRDLTEALSTYISLWRLRLQGVHSLRLKLHTHGHDDHDDVAVVIVTEMKNLFVMHLSQFIGKGEFLKDWEDKLNQKTEEIEGIDRRLSQQRRGITLAQFAQLTDQRNGLIKEKDAIRERLQEFKGAIGCLLNYVINVQVSSNEDDDESQFLSVFKFDDDDGGDFIGWERICCIILRECARLHHALPIYAYRQQIIANVDNNQITVLVGETGSGKSTQLVQYIADSGIANHGSIVCTQPRKIAALSLCDRVREESNGCYREDDSVTCYPNFSAAHQFHSKVIYMTDNCLLQHCMNDRNLSGISCIVVDEAHERSLNTDLLLSLIKDLLCQRDDLRLIIMSATADAEKLSDFFFSCEILNVVGRNYPVEVKYVPRTVEGNTYSGIFPSYVSDVLRMVREVHRTEEEGGILAFLTSQVEIEWACENFESSSAIALPFHGKLSFKEQLRVFQNFPGKRKVIFATNVAETSLTIPGVKYVIDSGFMKQVKYEPGTGMNLLRVCWISQSSANQRAGRAGRTEPGVCYRLYSENDFKDMLINDEPEIRRVHLGVAIMRILALGVNCIQSFDFVDAPSGEAIDMATRNLIQLGAVKFHNGLYHLTDDGQLLVKLGIEPQLGKLILGCCQHHLGREGVVLAALMTNAGSVFCRFGNDNEKQKSDCLKVQFCHPSGDLFTLLSVYKEWWAVPPDRRNLWCWENSINAKAMKRCQETIEELDNCLRKELAIFVPSNFVWNPHEYMVHDKYMKEIIFSSLSENIAMFSGYDRLGYEIPSTGVHVHLHPSCSLLNFSKKPSWVVFGELLSVSATKQYLVCVTAFDLDLFSTVRTPLSFNAFDMETKKLHTKSINVFGTIYMKRFCGKYNSDLISLVSRARSECMDNRIGIEVDLGRNEITIFASAADMDKISDLITDSLDYVKKTMRNECIEKCLYHGAGGSTSVALLGAGAEIKHLELEKRFLTVDVFYQNTNCVADKEILLLLEEYTSGVIVGLHKFGNDNEKWGRVTFCTPNAAVKATELTEFEFNGCILKVLPSQSNVGVDHKMLAFPAVKAKMSWPRRPSKGVAIVKCETCDVELMLNDFTNLTIGGTYVHAFRSQNHENAIVITGINKDLNETEVTNELRIATHRRITSVFLRRGDAIEQPTSSACNEVLCREFSTLMPRIDPNINSFQVHVFQPEPRDFFVRAMITFDGRLHLEAARALEQLDGKVLPGCLPWQKVRCLRFFHSSLTCPANVYPVVKNDVDALLAIYNRQTGVECFQERIPNGSFRVKISADSTKAVADMRRPLEALMIGMIVHHPSLNPAILQHLFSREGTDLQIAIGRETRTYVLSDRQNYNLRIFGSLENITVAHQKLVDALLSHYETKQLEIHLQGGNLPPNLMKEVVKKFGPKLEGLKTMFPEADFVLNPRRHSISIHGEKELKQKVEDIISDIAKTAHDGLATLGSEATCPICICEVEDGYRLEGCGHLFCHSCLLEQFDSAIKNIDSFPIHCAHEACGNPIVLTDIRLLLSSDRVEELFRASLRSFVESSAGNLRFCPSPDCPSVYRAAESGVGSGEPFYCGACYSETCRSCHLECHPYLSCEMYWNFKENPDLSLEEWSKHQDNVKTCPVCGHTIEKIDGCNHIECRCRKHICWVCLEVFLTSDDCYSHLRSVHSGI
ncbi:hypothetical protein ACFE04_014810 [Oxalis oulophora]